MYFDLERRIDRSLVEKMAEAIVHRGTDGKGSHIEGNVGFGNRRISITDLESEHQPLSDEDSQISCTLC